MMRYTFILLLLYFLTTTALSAQNDPDGFESFKRQYQNEYDDYRRQRMEEFAAFRKEANDKYAQWLGEQWIEMKAEKGLALPFQPKPVIPTIQKDSNDSASAVALPYSTIEQTIIQSDTIDVPDIILTPEQTNEQTEVEFYAEKLILRLSRGAASLRLKSTTERDIQQAWVMLSKGEYDALLQDCLSQKRKHHLCDWAYIILCRQAALSVYGNTSSNEVVLLQAFLLTQSGYKLRLAESEGLLSLLIPFDHTIYNYNYLTVDNTRYYVIDGRKSGSFRVVRYGFPRERTASIAIARQPQLAMRATSAKSFGGSGRYSEMKVTLGSNRNLMDFYSQYPISDAWSSYAKASLSESTKNILYPALRALIAGKSKQKAVDMLLDFVQHAFDYKTDREQFGYERPLFGDESFYYPYNDCEDRSIVFSILVRDLLGLDVVLLHYPGHLATAVDLGNSVKGDYVSVRGKRFVVCDPTYIGASIGESMPEFKNSKARIIVL